MKPKVIHKKGTLKDHAAHGVYMGFGQYGSVIGPVCEGSRGLRRGRSFEVAREWKYVTCKKCLKVKEV